MADHNWSSARADAARVGNFLQSLALAQGVFTEVMAAEAELARLLKGVAEARKEVGIYLAQAEEAKEIKDEVVKTCAEETERLTSLLDQHSRDVSAKRRALEEEAERDRLAFKEFNAKLVRQRKSAEEAHEVRVIELRGQEAAARSSMAHVEKQRQSMIDDLSGKETPDASA